MTTRNEEPARRADRSPEDGGSQPIHPERKRRVRTALRLFSVAAWETGTFLILLVVRMIAEYGFNVDMPAWATWVAILHGWFYMLFLLATINLGLKARWEPATWLVTAISGVVPVFSFVVEGWRRREVTRAFRLHER